MSALQELLNLGLVDIGSDDSRFEKIQSAAIAFAARLKEDPDLLIPATLIAIDNETDENDPLFGLVEELVIVEWNTLRNTHVNRPRELLRSIIINALMISIDGNPEASGVVYNTAASPYRHGQVRLGKAAEVVDRLLEEASNTAEAEAVLRAGLVSSAAKKRRAKKSTPETASLELKGAISADDILAGVERASGPHNAQSQAAETPNPHWPNTGETWSHEFAPRMTDALVKAVNLGSRRLVSSLSKSLNSYQKIIEERLRDEVSQAEQLCVEISESQNSSRMRLDVLWWSEALYSPLLGRSYREAELPVVSVAAAADLAAIVPALSPASVCYVLGEAVLRTSRTVEEETPIRPLGSYCGELKKAKIDFGKTFHYETLDEMRVPLLSLVGDASHGAEQTEKVFLSRAGLDSSLELTPGEFAMWVFRDIQAKRLVEELRK